MDKEKIQLQDTIELSVSEAINNIELFEFAKDNVSIIIRSYTLGKKIDFNEKEYYKILNIIVDKLGKYNKKYNIQIDVINRELFNNFFKLNDIPNNINLKMKVDFHPEINVRSSYGQQAYLYSIEEYINEEKFLFEMIKHIKESNLSQLEKYLKVYNIVKNFKPYAENDNNLYDSRTLKHILKNEYIVCVGFSILLKTLLDKINIPCTDLSVYYDSQIDNIKEIIGHQRNLIKIDDDKYNIHGIYISDPTFDHHLNIDLYGNCLVNINKRIELDDILLEDHTRDNIFNLIFNFKDEKDFGNKMDIDNISKYLNIKKELCYEIVFTTIIEILMDLDSNKSKYFYDKYWKDIKKYLLYENTKKYAVNIINESSENIDTIFNNFLNDYCNYIIDITTREVKLEVILKAVNNMDK